MSEPFRRFKITGFVDLAQAEIDLARPEDGEYDESDYIYDALPESVRMNLDDIEIELEIVPA